MDTPENFYAILGVPIDTDTDSLKRAYRQLARRFHPDLAGPDGALEMKRINRAYSVLSDPEQRQHYDIIISGVMTCTARVSHGLAHARIPLTPPKISSLKVCAYSAPKDHFAQAPCFAARLASFPR